MLIFLSYNIYSVCLTLIKNCWDTHLDQQQVCVCVCEQCNILVFHKLVSAASRFKDNTKTQLTPPTLETCFLVLDYHALTGSHEGPIVQCRVYFGPDAPHTRTRAVCVWREPVEQALYSTLSCGLADEAKFVLLFSCHASCLFSRVNRAASLMSYANKIIPYLFC